jgi:Domain of unknown function (DUF4266)
VSAYPRIVRLTRALGGALILAALAACAAPTPWVKPYEREHLADPIMSFNRNPVSSTYLEHVLETREGAHGATGAVGGGCGCN